MAQTKHPLRLLLRLDELGFRSPREVGPLDRERLLSMVWGEDFYGDARTIDVHVKSLRQKVGSRAEQIETVRGVGYRFRE